MELLVKIALWLHFLAVGVGGSATFGIPVVGRLMMQGPAEARPAVGATIDTLSKMGRVAIGTLIATGLFLVWARYDAATMPAAFWAKMLLVVLLIALVVYNVRTGKLARTGDGAAAARLPMLGKIGMGMFTLILLMATLAFQ